MPRNVPVNTSWRLYFTGVNSNMLTSWPRRGLSWAMVTSGWRAVRSVHIKAAREQVQRWIKAAAAKSMTLSAWVRWALDETAGKDEG